MKYNFVFLPILFTIFLKIGRAQDKTILNITYEFKHLRDIENKGNVFKANMILSIGPTQSRFVQESLFKANTREGVEARKKRMEQSMALAASSQSARVSGQPLFTVTNSGPTVEEEIFVDREKNQLFNSGRIGFRNYYYVAPIPKLKFELKPEKRNVLGYECQKATANFGGRNYEMWFTTALPYSFGPWKLQGLPGVILDASDSKGEVLFTAKEIAKNTDPEELMIQYMDPLDALKVKEREYKQTAEMLVKNPESIIAAQFPNTKVSIRNIEQPSNKNMTRVKKYNPIELQ